MCVGGLKATEGEEINIIDDGPLFMICGISESGARR